LTGYEGSAADGAAGQTRHIASKAVAGPDGIVFVSCADAIFNAAFSARSFLRCDRERNFPATARS